MKISQSQFYNKRSFRIIWKSEMHNREYRSNIKHITIQTFKIINPATAQLLNSHLKKLFRQRELTNRMNFYFSNSLFKT